MKTHVFLTALSTAAMLLTAGAASADDVRLYGDTVKASPQKSLKNMTLTVSGPNGFTKSEYSTLGSPSVSITNDGQMADGIYSWSLTGASDELVKANPMSLNNGRGENARNFTNKSVATSGMFRVIEGVIVQADEFAAEEPNTRSKR